MHPLKRPLPSVPGQIQGQSRQGSLFFTTKQVAWESPLRVGQERSKDGSRRDSRMGTDSSPVTFASTLPKVTHRQPYKLGASALPSQRLTSLVQQQEAVPITGKGAPEDRVPTGPQGACPQPQRDSGRQRGGDSGPQPPAPSGAADPLAGGQVAAGREAATCSAACRGRRDRELWGRTGAPPSPPGPGPFIKPKGIARAWQAWTPNCKLIKEFASHLHGNHFLGPQQRTVLYPSSILCPVRPIYTLGQKGPVSWPVSSPHLIHWESGERGRLAEHPPARNPACAPGELALPQWVQMREVPAKSFAPRPGRAQGREEAVGIGPKQLVVPGKSRAGG